MAENLLSRLARNPYAPIDGASVTRVDELGNGYDDFGQLIAPKLEAPQQTWGETALGVATAPARLATALAGSLSPYGADGWQIPPIVNEGVDALTAVGDAYSGKMAPEDINSRAIGMAGFMMGGGGIAARPAGSVAAGMPRVAAAKYGDKIYTGANHGEAYAKAVAELGEKTVDDLLMRDGQYDGFLDETGDFIDRLTAQQRANAPSAHAYDILAANASKEASVPAIAGALDMSTEARLARAREMGFDTDNVMYRGVATPSDELTANKGDWGTGVYMGNRSTANGYASGYDNWEGTAPAVYPLVARGPLATVADAFDVMDSLDAFKLPKTINATEAANQILRNRGFTGVTQGKGYNTLVFDPKDVRSVNAAFDPARSDSANLLAANADSRPALLAGSGQEQDIPDWLLPYMVR